MISGALPALMVFFIRLFVPESKKWEHERARGATSHWSNGDLIGVSVGCLASIAIIWSWSPAGVGPGAAALITAAGVAAALWGFLFPVRRYLARAVSAGSLAPHQQRLVIKHMLLGAGLAGVALLDTWRGDGSSGPRAGHFSSSRTRAAFLEGIHADLLRARRGRLSDHGGRSSRKIRTPHHVRSALPGDGSCRACCSTGNERFDGFFLFSIFLAGGIAGFYGLFPLYLPELFPTVVRATGRDSRTTSRIHHHQQPAKQQRSWDSSVEAFRWRDQC